MRKKILNWYGSWPYSMKMGSDSVVAAYTSVTQKLTLDGTEDQNATANGIEVGYNTTVGPATLGVGYGTQNCQK